MGVPVDSIRVPSNRLRELQDYSWLAESMERLGLLTPISITESGRLVIGRHRLEAAKSLKWETIPAFIVEDDELGNRLKEIDENLQRLDLTVYEQAKHAEERERVLKALGVRAKVGAGRGNTATVAGFSTTEDVAKEAGMSERSWLRRTKIGKALGPQTRAILDHADPTDYGQRNLLNSTTQLEHLANIANKRGDGLAAKVALRALTESGSNTFKAYEELRGEEKRAALAGMLAQRRLRAWQLSGERWRHDDWKDYIPTLENESVSLLLTDPPYGMNYQCRTNLVLHRTIENDDEVGALANLADMLEAVKPKLAEDAHLIIFISPRLEPGFRDVITNAGFALRSFPVWVKNNHGLGDLEGTFAPKYEHMIHAAKGDPKMVYRAPDIFNCARVPTTNHPTEKPVPLLKELIEATTREGEAVLDPYGGVASTLVAAELCGRIGLGCETDFDYHAHGLIRLEELLGGEAA